MKQSAKWYALRIILCVLALVPVLAEACTCAGRRLEQMQLEEQGLVAHVVVLELPREGVPNSALRVKVITPISDSVAGEVLTLSTGLRSMCGTQAGPEVVGAEWLLVASRNPDRGGVVGMLLGDLKGVSAVLPPCGETTLPVRHGLEGAALRAYLAFDGEPAAAWKPFSETYGLSSVVALARYVDPGDERRREWEEIEVITPLKNAHAGERLRVMRRGVYGGSIPMRCLSDPRQLAWNDRFSPPRQLGWDSWQDDRGQKQMVVVALSEVPDSAGQRRYLLNECGDYSLPVVRGKVGIGRADGKGFSAMDLQDFLRKYQAPSWW
jgi:hypothetical protein